MDSQLSLTSLLWDDILFAYVLPCLSLNDLFNLRGLSKDCKRLVDSYLGEMKELELNSQVFSVPRFKVLSNACHNLRILIIINCESITDSELKHLLVSNRMIKHLDITGCHKLTSLCLQPVIVFFKDLNCLILNSNIWLTTGCLEALALHHSKLETLCLHNCSSLGDVLTINNLLKKSRELHTLDLSGIDCISDSTMETLSHFNLKLQRLNIKYCRRVTEYGVRMVIEYCKELKKLIITGCSVSLERLLSVQSIKNILPMLQIEDVDINFAPAPRLMLQV